MLIDIGFDELKLSTAWDTDKKVKEDNIDIEKEIKNNKNPKTRLGDVIHLGNHIIVCGDSTKLETVNKFPKDTKVSMIYSDPVYNININY